MKYYPAIDLIGGNCVRLTEGDFAQCTQYAVDPLETARRFAESGAEYLHVIDLDGAREGRPVQRALIGTIARATSLTLQSGGGIRTVADAEALIAEGVARVIVGSLAVKEPAVARAIFAAVGADHFTLALDVRLAADGAPMVASQGWRATENVDLWSVLGGWVDLGLRHLLCTDIGRDGTLTGPNVDLYARILERYPHLEIQASGGIGGVADLRALKTAGIPAAVIGKALYERRFTLAEALQC